MSVIKSAEQRTGNLHETKRTALMFFWALAAALSVDSIQQATINPPQASADQAGINIIPEVMIEEVIATNTPKPTSKPLTPTIAPTAIEIAKTPTKVATKAAKAPIKTPTKAPTPEPTKTPEGKDRVLRVEPGASIDTSYFSDPGSHILVCGQGEKGLILDIYAPEKLRDGRVAEDQKPTGSAVVSRPPAEFPDCDYFFKGGTGNGGLYILRAINPTGELKTLILKTKDIESEGCKGKGKAGKELPENLGASGGNVIWKSCS